MHWHQSLYTAVLVLVFLLVGAHGYSLLSSDKLSSKFHAFFGGVFLPLACALMASLFAALVIGIDLASPWNILLFLAAVMVIIKTGSWLGERRITPTDN